MIFNCHIPNQQPLDLYRSLLSGGYSTNDINNSFSLNGHNYYKTAIFHDIPNLLKNIRKKWSLIQSSYLLDRSSNHQVILQARKDINSVLTAISEHLYSPAQLEDADCTQIAQSMNNLSALIVPLVQIEDEILSKLLLNTSTMVEHCLPYQYFHTYLELQYFCMIIKNNSCDKNATELYFIQMMQDLVVIAERTLPVRKTSFLCECVKHLWSIIQMLTDENFWTLFNKVMAGKRACFSIALLKDVAQLQMNNPNILPTANYLLLERLIKEVLGDPRCNADLIAKCLDSLEILLCDVWICDAKIDIYQNLWEHFARRLNVTLVPAISSAMTFVETVDNICSDVTCIHSKTADSERFMSMLMRHLKRHPQHWTRIKGRIYSQLGPNKLRELSTDEGIVRVALLYASLAVISEEESRYANETSL